MSHDKQRSGPVVCEREIPAHARDKHDDVAWPFCVNPRPASPTPEQPAQDLTEEEIALRGVADFIEERCGIRTGPSLNKAILAFAAGRALAPPAQTQQGLSGELLRLMAAAYDTQHLDSCDHGDETSGCYACHAETIMWAEFRSLAFGSPAPHAKRDAQATIAALNPDKQPSPSAAPAQEPESSKALRSATIQEQSTKEVVNESRHEPIRSAERGDRWVDQDALSPGRLESAAALDGVDGGRAHRGEGLHVQGGLHQRDDAAPGARQDPHPRPAEVAAPAQPASPEGAPLTREQFDALTPEEIRARYEASFSLPLDEGAKSVERARALIAKYEPLASPEPAPEGALREARDLLLALTARSGAVFKASGRIATIKRWDDGNAADLYSLGLLLRGEAIQVTETLAAALAGSPAGEGREDKYKDHCKACGERYCKCSSWDVTREGREDNQEQQSGKG